MITTLLILISFIVGFFGGYVVASWSCIQKEVAKYSDPYNDDNIKYTIGNAQ